MLKYSIDYYKSIAPIVERLRKGGDNNEIMSNLYELLDISFSEIIEVFPEYGTSINWILRCIRLNQYSRIPPVEGAVFTISILSDLLNSKHISYFNENGSVRFSIDHVITASQQKYQSMVMTIGPENIEIDVLKLD